ncbi:unnamed protein product [Lathyrus oleraceus]
MEMVKGLRMMKIQAPCRKMIYEDITMDSALALEMGTWFGLDMIVGYGFLIMISGYWLYKIGYDCWIWIFDHWILVIQWILDC